MIREQSVGQTEIFRESRAYRMGWKDGRFGSSGVFSSNAGISSWADMDRLAYYQGHREGRRIREMLQDTARLA